jgi:hypothetical protein
MAIPRKRHECIGHDEKNDCIESFHDLEKMALRLKTKDIRYKNDSILISYVLRLTTQVYLTSFLYRIR